MASFTDKSLGSKESLQDRDMSWVREGDNSFIVAF